MSLGALVSAELMQRLNGDLRAHETLVREVVDAHVSGQLEADVAIRTCALELHSLKGVASVLGFKPIVTLIGGTCEAMLRVQVAKNPEFFRSFASWFSSFVACVRACAEGVGVDDAAMEAMSARREELLAMLGAGSHKKSERTLAEEARRETAQLSPSGGRKLLIVDDSATVRAALSAKLTDRGYPVRAAKSLAEAAQLLASFEPEIVVTDVQMPEVEGDELCRRIKAHMSRIVPVILYSSLAEEELRARAEAALADGYVCKSDGVDALIARMDELLSDEILF